MGDEKEKYTMNGRANEPERREKTAKLQTNIRNAFVIWLRTVKKITTTKKKKYDEKKQTNQINS